MSSRTTPAGTFAFTVHPRARLSEDLGRVWSPLRRVPEPVFDSAMQAYQRSNQSFEVPEEDVPTNGNGFRHNRTGDRI